MDSELKVDMLYTSGLAREELMRIVKSSAPWEQRFMLKFFKTKDMNIELQRRGELMQDSIMKILDAADNAKDSISDLEDAEAFISAITATLRGIVK